MQTLELLPNLKTNRVMRITLIKDLNMNRPEKWAELIEKAKPNFVEVKAYMNIGASINRLPFEAMPSHEEVKSFAEEIEKHCSYKIKDDSPPSRVVLMVGPL